MAFVGISKDFMERVKVKIHNMHQAEIKTLGEVPTVSITDREPWVLKTLWGDHVHLIDQMPENWMQKLQEVRLKVEINNPDLLDKADRQFSFKVNPPSKIVAPPNFNWYDETSVSADCPQIVCVVEYATKFKEIQVRWANVLGQVTQFLYSCKSANEAVKLWPDVKMYFDHSDINRLEVKTVRSGTAESEGAKKLAELDTSSLTSAAIIARMSGATV
jgi:hypothetical protein